jgi:hypothetical protein
MKRRSFLKFLGLAFVAPLDMLQRIPAAPKPRMLKATWTRELKAELMGYHGISKMETGITYLPYIPLYKTKVMS